MAERQRASAERQRAGAHLVAMSSALAEAKTDAERDLCQVVYDAAWKLYQATKAAEDAALGAAPPETTPPSVVWADLYEQRGWIRLFRVFPGTIRPSEEILSRDTVLSKRSPLLMMNPQEGMSWAAVKDLLHALGVKIHELT